jgi:hypothetical protein
MIGTLGQLVREIRDRLAGTDSAIVVDIGTDVTSVPPRTAATTSVTSSDSSVTILASNSDRKGVSVSNISTSNLYLSYTSPASVSTSFIEVPPGAFILLDQQLIVTSAIYGVWSEVNGVAQVTEYV